MRALFLTLDNLAHLSAAASLVYLLHFSGPWGLAVAVSLIFVVREAEQHEAKYPGTRWEPWTWNMHKHVEWAAGAVGAFIVAGLIAAFN